MRAAAALCFFLSACPFAAAWEFTGEVIAVTDGDTLQVLHESKLLKIRLAGVDAPELTQEFGMTARQMLAGLVLGKQVRVSTRGKDVFGRTVAQVSVDHVAVENELVRRGLAWVSGRQGKNGLSDASAGSGSHATLMALQHEAKSAGRGLWSRPDPVPPHLWRKARAGSGERHTTSMQLPGCGSSARCDRLRSCDEAIFTYRHCGAPMLDSDGDGVPCEGLCTALHGAGEAPGAGAGAYEQHR